MRKQRSPENLRNLSMQELFRVEAENQTSLLTSGLLALEKQIHAPAPGGQKSEGGLPTSDFRPLTSGATPEQLESLMRAAHSFKGAARIVNLSPAVHVAHALEDCFVAAQQNRLALQQEHIDVLLRGVDWLTEISRQHEHTITTWEKEHGLKVESWIEKIRGFTPPRLPESEIRSQRPEGEGGGLPTSDLRPLTSGSARPSGDTSLYKTAEIKTGWSSEGKRRIAFCG